MKPFHFLPRVLVILGSFFIAHTSAAYLQYTYTSDALEWQTTFLNDYDWGAEINNDPDGKIEFGFSFNLDESLLSSTSPSSFIIQNAEIVTDTTMGNEYYEPDFHSLVYGKVIINPDRTIKFWNLIFAIEARDLNESTYLNNLINHNVRVISAGGTTTCNCDRFWEDVNIVTRRPQNTWIVAATLDNYYRNDSDFDNWSLTQISVSEPGSLILVALGLTGFLVMRRREND